MPTPAATAPTVAMPGQSGDLFADHSASTVAEEAQHRTVVYDTILNWADFDQWLERLHKTPLAAIDTETDSLDEMRAQIVGISFSVQAGEAAYIPLRHEGPDAPAQLPLDEVLVRLKPWLENPKHHKLGQHIKYDRHVFANHGIEVQGYAHDTMLQSYVLEVHKPHNLTSLAERHTGRKGITYEDLCGKGAHQIPFAQVPVDKAAAYSCEDSDQTLDVHNALWPLLQADDKLRFIYELEMQSSEALYRIERNGVLIDAPTLAAQSHELGQRILQLETEQPQAVGRNLLRQAGHAGGEEDRHRRPQHRRRSAGKAGRGLPPARQAAGAPQPRQAQRHLHRQARPTGAATHRPRAHALRAGRGCDRPLVQQRPQPAEHPHPHARRPPRA